MTALFYTNDEEKKLAEQSKEKHKAKKKTEIYTKILPLTSFTNAEDYHQKYYLRTFNGGKIVQLLGFSDKEIINSTLAARLNAAVDGKCGSERVDKELENAGIKEDVKKQVMELLKARMRW